MALSGIQIYKFLPKTNCKKCGQPTCLAFAMKLATKTAELSLCPDVTAEAKNALEAASRPPIRLVTLASGDKKISVGNETVMCRHEKTFVNKPGLVIRVKDNAAEDAITQLVSKVAAYAVERVGITMKVDGIAVDNASGNPESFAKCVQLVRAKTDLPLVLISKDPAAIGAALEKLNKDKDKPLIYAATRDNYAKMAELAKKHGTPLAVFEPAGLTELADLSDKVNKAGIEDIVLDPGARDFGQSLTTLTQIRRQALRKSLVALGYPIITFPGEAASSPEQEAILAGQQIAKYAGIIVLDHFSASTIYPLLTLRLNIYTDPQKPIQMTPDLYQIGTPNTSSPVCVTTNFSLTYFSIAGELEASGYPSWLLVCDTEGLSVLTSWAAGKFDAEKIAKTVKQRDIASKVNHRNIIIPGHVAVLRGELEEELPDWKIMVGPREAVEVGGFLKKHWAA